MATSGLLTPLLLSTAGGPPSGSVLQVLIIAGGVALILFGIRFLRNGLDRLFGPRLRYWIQRLTRDRFSAFVSGLGVAVIAPSSTTISVLAVQTIQAGHATVRQMLAFVFGSDIGVTATIILLAFRLEHYAPILVLIGLPLYQLTSATRTRGLGQVILSISFIFLGVLTIKNTTNQITPDQHLIDLIKAAGHYPMVLAVIAAVAAVALQSSTATISMLIGLSMGPLPIDDSIAIPAVIGANVGVALTMLLVSINQAESRQLAWGNLLAKLVVAIICLALIDPLMSLFEMAHSVALPARIAMMHTGFNVVLATLALPFTRQIAFLAARLAPAPSPQEHEEFGPRYINDGPIESVALATGQSLREILRVGEIVREMLDDAWRALRESNESLNQSVSNRDDEVDLLDSAIKRFLTRLAVQGLDRADAAEQMRQLRYLNELETIGDIIDKNLSELITKKIRSQAEFSKDGWQELEGFHQKVRENMIIAETAFSTRDQLLARKLLRHKERIAQTERDLRDQHFNRLNSGLAESHETSAIHLDLLTHLKRINSCVTHIAYAILQGTDRDEG